MHEKIMRVCICFLAVALAATASTAPVPKMVNWFVSPSISPAKSKFLLSSGICDGVYTCCGGYPFLPNGSVALKPVNRSAIKPFVDAGVRVLATFGGDFLPEAAYERRSELAQQICAGIVAHLGE